MLSSLLRGWNTPHSQFITPPDDPLRPEEARFDAWARALGQSSTFSAPARKPNRGQLPDLDFSRVTPVPRKPLLLAGAWRFLLGRKTPIGSPAVNLPQREFGDWCDPSYMPHEKAYPFSTSADGPESDHHPISRAAWARG